MGIEIMKGRLQQRQSETPKKCAADKGATTILVRCCSDPKVNISHFREPKVWECSFIDHLHHFGPLLPGNPYNHPLVWRKTVPKLNNTHNHMVGNSYSVVDPNQHNLQ